MSFFLTEKISCNNAKVVDFYSPQKKYQGRPGFIIFFPSFLCKFHARWFFVNCITVYMCWVLLYVAKQLDRQLEQRDRERKWKKISRNKRFPVCVGTRLMMFVWSVKHLHDMELNYRLSNAETGLLLNLPWIA